MSTDGGNDFKINNIIQETRFLVKQSKNTEGGKIKLSKIKELGNDVYSFATHVYQNTLMLLFIELCKPA